MEDKPHFLETVGVGARTVLVAPAIAKPLRSCEPCQGHHSSEAKHAYF